MGDPSAAAFSPVSPGLLPSLGGAPHSSGMRETRNPAQQTCMVVESAVGEVMSTPVVTVRRDTAFQEAV